MKTLACVSLKVMRLKYLAVGKFMCIHTTQFVDVTNLMKLYFYFFRICNKGNT